MEAFHLDEPIDSNYLDSIGDHLTDSQTSDILQELQHILNDDNVSCLATSLFLGKAVSLFRDPTNAENIVSVAMEAADKLERFVQDTVILLDQWERRGMRPDDGWHASKIRTERWPTYSAERRFLERACDILSNALPTSRFSPHWPFLFRHDREENSTLASDPTWINSCSVHVAFLLTLVRRRNLIFPSGKEFEMVAFASLEHVWIGHLDTSGWVEFTIEEISVSVVLPPSTVAADTAPVVGPVPDSCASTAPIESTKDGSTVALPSHTAAHSCSSLTSSVKISLDTERTTEIEPAASEVARYGTYVEANSKGIVALTAEKRMDAPENMKFHSDGAGASSNSQNSTQPVISARETPFAMAGFPSPETCCDYAIRWGLNIVDEDYQKEIMFKNTLYACGIDNPVEERERPPPLNEAQLKVLLVQNAITVMRSYLETEKGPQTRKCAMFRSLCKWRRFLEVATTRQGLLSSYKDAITGNLLHRLYTHGGATCSCSPRFHFRRYVDAATVYYARALQINKTNYSICTNFVLLCGDESETNVVFGVSSDAAKEMLDFLFQHLKSDDSSDDLFIPSIAQQCMNAVLQSLPGAFIDKLPIEGNRIEVKWELDDELRMYPATVGRPYESGRHMIPFEETKFNVLEYDEKDGNTYTAKFLTDELLVCYNEKERSFQADTYQQLVVRTRSPKKPRVEVGGVEEGKEERKDSKKRSASKDKSPAVTPSKRVAL